MAIKGEGLTFALPEKKGRTGGATTAPCGPVMLKAAANAAGSASAAAIVPSFKLEKRG